MLWLSRMKSRPVLVICALTVDLYAGRGLFISLQQHGTFPIAESMLFFLAVLLTVVSGFIGKRDR
jgi:hypothetical protein